MSDKKKFLRPSNIVMTTLLAVLVGAAVADQLRRPAGERTWQGKIVGVPYDFRVPTVERVRNTFWNPNNPNLLVPHAFGIGWSINVYPLVHPQKLLS